MTTNIQQMSLLPSGFFTTIIFSIIIYHVCKWSLSFYKYRHRVRQLMKLPGISGHWLLGGLVEFPGAGEVGLAFMRKRIQEYPKISYAFYGPINIGVIVVHPEPVKTILKTSEPKPHKFGGYFNSEPWLGEGLLIAGGKKWARNRRLLTPAFHFDILKPYIAINNRAADVLIDKLSRQKGEYFEVFSHISLCTLEIILKCAFSYEEDVQAQGETHPYVTAIAQLAHTVLYRSLRPWLYPNFLFYMSEKGKEFKKNCDHVHKVAEDVIRKRQNTLKSMGKENFQKQKKYLDFLDILLTAEDENGSGLSDMEIRHEVDTFLFEGHDTTASGISWTLYSLAQDKQWQKRCQDEIDDILHGRDSEEILWEDLSQFSVLTACIKESLRNHTTVPFIQRQTTKDMYIDGYFIPANTQIDINIYAIMHNQTVWDDPVAYKPDRFLGDQVNKMDSFAFIPFSAGPRNCIGQNFAMHEMKVIIARILRRFDLDVDPERPARHEMMLVMKTENGMYIKATPRHTDS